MPKTDKIVHGCDYNPDQWIKTPEIIDEDKEISLNTKYTNVLTGEPAPCVIGSKDFIVIR